MANVITNLFRFKEDGGGLAKIRADVAQTDGAINKFKTGAGGAFDFVKANAAGLAASGGAAIVGFGVKAAQAFVDTAMEAKNLASLTGDTVEQSSRLNAIWKQSGADAKDLQDVLLQMNGVLSTNKDLVRQLGINLEDGATVGQRFEQVADALDKIPDAARRSQIASQVFGEEGVRQYNALRNAVGDVGDAMANVSDSQVIDEDEVRKAEELAARMREVNAAVQGFIVAAGEAAIEGASFIKEFGTSIGNLLSGPEGRRARQANEEYVRVVEDAERAARDFDRALLDTAKTTADVRRITEEYGLAIEAQNILVVEWAENQKAVQEQLKQTTTAQDMIAESIANAQRNLDRFGPDGVEQMGAVEEAADDTAEAVDGIAASVEDLRDEINNRKAYRDLERAFEDVQKSAVDAFGAAAAGADDAAEKARDHADRVDDLRLELLDYLDSLGSIPAEKRTEILAAIDAQAYAEAERLLALLERERIINVRINTGQINPSLKILPNEKAADGSYNAGGLTMINDGLGGELVQLPNGSKVMTAANTANHLRGGSSVPVVVNINNHVHNNRIVATGPPAQVAAAMSRRVRGRL